MPTNRERAAKPFIVVNAARGSCSEFENTLTHPARRVKGYSANAKGDSCNQISAKTVLQPVQNLLAMIPNDFAQPYTAVHVYKQSPFMQPHWLRVRDDIRVEQMVPDFDDLHFGLALVYS